MKSEKGADAERGEKRLFLLLPPSSVYCRAAAVSGIQTKPRERKGPSDLGKHGGLASPPVPHFVTVLLGWRAAAAAAAAAVGSRDPLTASQAAFHTRGGSGGRDGVRGMPACTHTCLNMHERR